MWIANDFRDVIADRLEELESMESSVVGLRTDMTVAFVNTAWTRFATDNGGAESPLAFADRPVIAFFSPAVRPFYRGLFEAALQTRDVQEHVYECPSPSIYRRFKLRVIPIERGLLGIHHLAEERPHGTDRVARPAREERYRDASGLITQCAHCRLVRRADSLDTWEWVPDFVGDPPRQVTHGICPTCLRHFYPQLAQRYSAYRAAKVDIAPESATLSVDPRSPTPEPAD